MELPTEYWKIFWRDFEIRVDKQNMECVKRAMFNKEIAVCVDLDEAHCEFTTNEVLIVHITADIIKANIEWRILAGKREDQWIIDCKKQHDVRLTEEEKKIDGYIWDD